MKDAAHETPRVRALRKELGLTLHGARSLLRVRAGLDAKGGTGAAKLVADGFLALRRESYMNHRWTRFVLTDKGEAACAALRAAGF